MCTLHNFGRMAQPLSISFGRVRGMLLLLLTLLWGIAFSSSAAERRSQKSFVVVVDAGHGGHDAGTCGNGLKEKDITLDIALKVGHSIKARYPQVRVLYTRDKDVFVKLHERAGFANRNKADLFISIHVNSAPNKAVYGTETFVLGSDKADKNEIVNETNLRVVMRENQAITLEDDYRETYHGFDPSSTESYIAFSMIKNIHYDQSVELGTYIQEAYHSAGRKADRGVRPGDLLVVRNVAMPSVLTEVGFITNKSEAQFMAGQTGRKQLADAIVRGFGRYYRRFTGSVSETTVSEDSTKEEKVVGDDSGKDENATEVAPETTVRTSEKTPKQASQTQGTTYGVQLISASKKVKVNDPQFKGYAVRCELVGKRYAYIHGSVNSLDKAKQLRKKVRKHFKDAFIVRYKDGKREEAIY
ncbi:N-acetylmuramoyl-L-alanine amidase [Porphyromonas crevioricanis JCM 15906]|uniref:N-acetylmuramoyl-L-alanine amidase n=2 Tax=Porphyromonas crevioricanis TaxID=393921 RepID=A0A2X4STK4_9PORP|nr:N-acetylmuramoyl-L-alanine amidase [Porphyromonas crevioricanis]GAD04377.1 N-acetylmuramoyl-L-alanine amidase [Porphyromonas crevioricanis JCM 15906]SJZ87115.1 N-acetylmuramoyl-L-alanine amidase [Porphyromonas crevioricanis]SQH73171.1 N-acetylmuramoyl-L-alanine amidase AmiB precursor [Porphyromonas crevioricanis]